MAALSNKHHSLCRWLLSLPGLDANIRNEMKRTALEKACLFGAPLDIVITLVRLSSWETINMKSCQSLVKRRNWGFRTDMDLAVPELGSNTSTALYLSWLGAECKEENRKYRVVTLQTW